MVSRTAHPMGVLAALTSALTAFNPKMNVDNEKKCIKPFARRWGNS
jgi:citrate synthase